jgi:hypothetical protein
MEQEKTYTCRIHLQFVGDLDTTECEAQRLIFHEWLKKQELGAVSGEISRVIYS